MTILESISCGTPVILTDVCGISEIIEKNNVGFVVKYSKDDLKKALLKSLYPEMNKKFENNYKNLLKQEFDLKIVVKKIEKVYNNLNEMR